MLRAGALDRRIAIQQKTGGADAWGTALPDVWCDVAQVWASVRYQTGSESIRAGVDTSVVKASIRIRWRADIDAGMRVVYAGQNYDIEAVLPGATREHLDLVCKVVT